MQHGFCTVNVEYTVCSICTGVAMAAVAIDGIGIIGIVGVAVFSFGTTGHV